MENLDILKLFAQFGVPTVLLALVVWKFVIPIFDAFIENIKLQTKVLTEILQRSNETHERLDRIEDKLDALDKINFKLDVSAERLKAIQFDANNQKPQT